MTDLGRSGEITPAELALATRNRGMPLEAMRHDVTPVGLHYMLVHFDIPALDPKDVAAADHRRRRARAGARPRGDPAPAGADDPGDAGVRGQRPGPARAAADQPAVADRGDRHGASGPAPRSGDAARRGRASRRRRRARLHRRRPRHRGRGRSTTTPARCPSPRRSRPTVLLAYEMNGGRSSRSTAIRCVSSSPAGTG